MARQTQLPLFIERWYWVLADDALVLIHLRWYWNSDSEVLEIYDVKRG